jgi:conserved repeat domain
MKLKFYLSKTLLIPLFLMGMLTGLNAQDMDLSKAVANITTGLGGSVAEQGHILEYTIVIRNLSPANITSSTLYDNIPAGVSYIAGSTTLNGSAVADVSGRMPFAATGGLIRSPMYGPGILAPNVPATIQFRVKVTANAGNVTNHATLQGNYNGNVFYQNTNTVTTNLTEDSQCDKIYQSTAKSTGGVPNSDKYRFIKTVSTSDGTGGSILFNGDNDPCFNATTGANMSKGSVLQYASAIAYDRNTNRIYFVNNYRNNPPEELCYVDLTTKKAGRYVGYPLEPNISDGYNINRMCFASDGFGYAITSNAKDLIRFSVNPVTNLPTITQLGPLLNDPNNGSNDVLDESGGDIFGDGSGKLYMIANSSKLYKINPATRVATYLGKINPKPPANSNSIAIDLAGNVYIGGAYRQVYQINLTTMEATRISPLSQSNVWTNGDYTSCAFPVLAPVLTASKTYQNINGSPFVMGGDTVEYTITVLNDGNINAAGVRLYDGIPTSTNYIPNSTYLNGNHVPDVAGAMPYSVAGGKLIQTAGEDPGIIRPGYQYRAVVSFRVKISPLAQICNQSRITLIDGDGNTIFINSDDPTQPGSQNPTCFFSDGVLPLTNLSFRGTLNNDRSVLTWIMADESNVAHYEVEYSDNGIHFTTAGKINANGSKTYQFIDITNTMAGNRFYRLKLVQMGGSHTYSAIVRLNLKGLEVQVQPNPFEKDLNLQIQIRTAENVRIRLLDLTSREVYHSAEKLSAGTHSLSIQLPANLSRGMYVVEVLAGKTQLFQQKLIKR